MLDWNQPAIDFYQAAGARPMDGWTVYRLRRRDAWPRSPPAPERGLRAAAARKEKAAPMGAAFEKIGG
ncbi:hypothetical protein XPN_4452 [Xanthomonas arboricola pv. pruni MAFF 301427]|nr:hypothetical protein XPN_4452 [Xanthomonas arboricola pv. pruni MAFF 301427]